jgi:hypothetical protein
MLRAASKLPAGVEPLPHATSDAANASKPPTNDNERAVVEKQWVKDDEFI